MKVHRMKAFSFFRSSLAGGCYQGACKPEETNSGFIPKVPSLLFDLELEDGTPAFAEKQEDAGAPTVAAHIRSLTEPRSEEECQLASHMQLVQRLLIEGGERQGLDIFEVAEGLRKLGHAVTIRTALGGGGGNECLRNLRHSFLTCRVQGAQGLVNYIVDPCFKEQFEIAHVNPRYSCVLSEVPASFVGTEEQIIAVVEIMSKEISRAFKQAGATLPPWRQVASMLSKWQPRKSEDLSFDGQTLDSRTPSLPQELPPPVVRHHLGGPGHGYLQRNSTSNAWPTRRAGAGATARVSLDEARPKGRVSVDDVSRRKISESPSTPVLASRGAVQPAACRRAVVRGNKSCPWKSAYETALCQVELTYVFGHHIPAVSTIQ